jgi:dolichol-phosphate mannosyltransferase
MTLAPGQGVSGPKVFQLPPSCLSPDTAPRSPFGRLLRMASGAGPGRTDGSVPGLGRVIMVVPTYNEALNLEPLLERLRRLQPDVDVLVVDDSSPDGTGELADTMAAEDPAVTVLHRTTKEGLGAAYLNGFQVALARGYDVIGEMDADGSHQPEQLQSLLDALPGADLVIGSRWVPGGSIENWPRHRELLSRAGNFYTRTLLGIGVRDATAGYRLFRRTTLERIGLHQVESAGYVFQADLAFRTLRAGLRVVEVPIEFIERERGDSKMSRRVATESLRRITRWGLGERARQARTAIGRLIRRRAEQPPAAGR